MTLGGVLLRLLFPRCEVVPRAVVYRDEYFPPLISDSRVRSVAHL